MVRGLIQGEGTQVEALNTHLRRMESVTIYRPRKRNTLQANELAQPLREFCQAVTRLSEVQETDATLTHDDKSSYQSPAVQPKAVVDKLGEEEICSLIIKDIGALSSEIFGLVNKRTLARDIVPTTKNLCNLYRRLKKLQDSETHLL